MSKQDSVFLVGPMGSGKTAVGLQLARDLGVEFLDSDAEIEHASTQNLEDCGHMYKSMQRGWDKLMARH